MRIRNISVYGLLSFLFCSCMLEPPYIPMDGRSPAPDLKREILLLNGLAEVGTIMNPAIAGETFFAEELETDAILHNNREYSLEAVPYYAGAQNKGIVPLGKWPNQFLFNGVYLFSLASGDNHLLVFNESTLEIRTVIDLGNSVNPYAMALDPDNAEIVYISGFLSRELIKVDVAAKTVLGRVKLPSYRGETVKGPEGIAVQDGKVYIACTNWNSSLFGYDPGIVAVYDSSTLELLNIIDIESPENTARYLSIDHYRWGANPQSILPYPDLHEVHIVCTGSLGIDDPDDGEWQDYMSSDDGEIVIINTDPVSADEDTIVGRLNIGGSPLGSVQGYNPATGITWLGGIGSIRAYRPGEGAGSSDPPAVFAGNGSEEPFDPAPSNDADYYPSLTIDPVHQKLFIASFNNDTVLVYRLNGTARPEWIDSISVLDGPLFLLLTEEE